MLFMMHALESLLSYSFTDQALLLKALTHRSFGPIHNERLEFLGDAFLNTTMAHWLYTTLPEQPEGVLARSRAFLVKKELLMKYACSLSLQDHLRVGPGEVKDDAFFAKSLLPDAFEALLGALLLDASFEKAYQVFIAYFEPMLLKHLGQAMEKDPKTRLQEFAQQQGSELPVYLVDKQTGAEHHPTFKVKCMFGGLNAMGDGPSKKQAEYYAAEQLLLLLQGKDLHA